MGSCHQPLKSAYFNYMTTLPHQRNMSAPCHHRTPRLLSSQKQQCTYCLDSQILLNTTSLNTPCPLSNGQSTPSTFLFLPSWWTKHEHHLHLDLAPMVAPLAQHTCFPSNLITEHSLFISKSGIVASSTIFHPFCYFSSSFTHIHS